MKLIRTTVSSIAIVAMLTSAPAYGQQQGITAGAWGAGTVNIHRGDFTTYDGLLACGEFTNTTGFGWMAGYTMAVPVTEVWRAEARLAYYKADGTFSALDPVSPMVAMPDGGLVRMASEYDLDVALDYVVLDAMAAYAITDRMRVMAGPQLGLATRASYEHTERILSPRTLVFDNGTDERVLAAAAFSNPQSPSTSSSLRLGITAGLTYSIPVTQSIVLVPEVAATYGVTNVMSTFTWNVHTLRAGIGLTWNLQSPEAPPPVALPPQQPVVVPQVAAAEPVRVELDVVANDAEGTVTASEVTVIEDRTIDLIPLLPYVFFDQGASQIPSRYALRATSDGFTPEEGSTDVIDTYHSLLDIIGHRLRTVPSATLTLTGCREPMAGDTSMTVARERAETVARYLSGVWGIAPERLQVRSRDVPERPSNRGVDDGRVENRRVELASSDVSILAPVRRSRTQTTIVPRPLTLMPTVTNAPQTKVTVAAANGTVLYAATVPTGSVGTWDPDANQLRSLAVAGQRRLTATAEASGMTAQRGISLRRIQRSVRLNGDVVQDSIIERYRLVFFEFDAATISVLDAPTIDLIRKRMRTSSRVTITGLTDRIGDAGYNTGLSQRRADAVRSAIVQRIVPESLTAGGAGPQAIHDNNLPEGRMYNRTVILEVATPVEGEEER
jgi:outer membrane protein OmpA-like peptidoglycan-associated protein